MKIKCNGKNFPDYKKSVFITQNDEIVNLLEECLEKVGSQQELAEILGCTQALISCWKRKVSCVSLFYFWKLCELASKNPVQLLENKELRGRCGGGSLTFSIGLFKKLLWIDGFIRGDGTIRTSAGLPIVFYQNDKEVLEYAASQLKEIGLKNLLIDKPKNRESWYLTVCSTPLKFILVNLLENPVGKKPIELKPIPFDKIPNINRVDIIKWLSGLIVAEGSFDYSSRCPTLVLSMKSKLPLYVRRILKTLNYNCCKVDDKRESYSTIKLQGHHQFAKFAGEVIEFFPASKKLDDLIEILSNEKYLMRFHYNPRDLFKYAWKVVGTQEDLRIRLSQIMNTNLPRWTLQHWIKNDRRPPLKTILQCCELLNINPFDRIEKDLHLLLKLHLER